MGRRHPMGAAGLSGPRIWDCSTLLAATIMWEIKGKSRGKAREPLREVGSEQK